jgi:hypothetical protein
MVFANAPQDWTKPGVVVIEDQTVLPLPQGGRQFFCPCLKLAIDRFHSEEIIGSETRRNKWENRAGLMGESAIKTM